MRKSILIVVLVLQGLVAVLLTGCSYNLTDNFSPQPILQIAAQVARGQTSLEDLRMAAVNSGGSDPQSSAALCAIDQDNNLYIDDREILVAVQAWVEGTPIEGEYIGDTDMLVAVAAWIEQTRLTCGPSPLNKPPVAEFTFSPSAPKAGDIVTFDASSSYDPDGIIIKYAWDFGDGMSAIGERVSHAYSLSGNYTVRLTVTDNNGATDSVQQVITVEKKLQSNRSPHACFTYTVDQRSDGIYVTVDGSCSYDPDGYIVSYDWYWNDQLATHHIASLIWGPYTGTGTVLLGLTVIDNNGASDYTSETIYLESQPPPYQYQVGDIVAVDYVEGSECDLPLPYDPDEYYSYDHVGIIVQGGTYDEVRIVESQRGSGVRETRLREFVNTRVSKCAIRAIELWSVSAPTMVKEEAARLAKTAIGASYSSLLEMIGKGELDGSYYCSELVWIAYQMAWHWYKGTQYVYGGSCFLFLDADDEGQSIWGEHCGWDEPVTPSDIVYSKWTTYVRHF